MRASFVSLGLLVGIVTIGCGSSSQTPPPKSANLPPPILGVALEVTGKAANADKASRCAAVGAEWGIAVDPAAPIHAVLELGDQNRARVVGLGAPFDEPMPQWPIPFLCAELLGHVVDASPRHVEVTKAEPPPGACAEHGAIDSSLMVSGPFGALPAAMPTYNAALSSLKLKSLRSGANLIVLDTTTGAVGGGITLGARLYTCGGAAPAATTAPAPAGPSCFPDCSPGYLCAQGTCISACNPPCPANQRCGADRICR